MVKAVRRDLLTRLRVQNQTERVLLSRSPCLLDDPGNHLLDFVFTFPFLLHELFFFVCSSKHNHRPHCVCLPGTNVSNGVNEPEKER